MSKVGASWPGPTRTIVFVLLTSYLAVTLNPLLLLFLGPGLGLTGGWISMWIDFPVAGLVFAATTAASGVFAYRFAQTRSFAWSAFVSLLLSYAAHCGGAFALGFEGTLAFGSAADGTLLAQVLNALAAGLGLLIITAYLIPFIGFFGLAFATLAPVVAGRLARRQRAAPVEPSLPAIRITPAPPMRESPPTRRAAEDDEAGFTLSGTPPRARP